MSYSKVLDLTSELLARASVTPDDAGCQQIIADRLTRLGFTVTSLPFGNVQNLWASRGDRGPLLAFAGHTDVVPVGNAADWQSDPFIPTVRGGYLYGRGSADMKGSIAAMLIAVEAYLEQHPEAGRIAFLITSDEEGPAVDGTARVVAWLKSREIIPDFCIVGEPSSSKVVGDVIRIGRRGSLNGSLTVRGIQGHVAYPDLVRNPIHEGLPALAALATRHWDDGNDAFPPTSLQISNIAAGTGATNVVPGTLHVDFNLRFSTEQTSSGLMTTIESLFSESAIDHQLQWTLSGEPFLTPRGKLLESAVTAIEEIAGIPTDCSTGGGTSDGRFIAPLGCELIELGPVNATIHQVDECVALEDLVTLSTIYHNIMSRLLVNDA